MSVTVILNIWKRNYLEEQLSHLLNQRVRPEYVWIVQYENHSEVESLIETFRKFFHIEYFHFSKNLKYYGRFSIANFVSTEYVWLLDDDVMPGAGWLGLCLDRINKYNAVISCSGRIMEKDNFTPELAFSPQCFIGDYHSQESNYVAEDTFVDFGIQSYFIRSEWLRSFWNVYPFTFETGEDIHLAATLKVEKGISCLVPRQDSKDNCGNLNIRYGRDEHSSWRMSDFIEQRKRILEYFILEKGWKPVSW